MEERVVLLVEDNAATRQLVRVVLGVDGIRVVEASSARAALPTAASVRPDLVLLDIGLPDGNGLDLLDDLRACVGMHVPIVAFTGVVSAANEGRLAGAGFDDIIAKPIDGARLRDTLRAHLPDAGAGGERFGEGKTLLLVDDDPVQRKLGLLRLSRLGFRVVGAGDGREGFAIAQREKPDIVVSDVLMPEVDGFELCAQLRNEPLTSRIPIVLVTNSYLEEADRDLATRVGADAFVVRTSDLRELTDILRAQIVPKRRVPSSLPGSDPAGHVGRLERAAHQLDRQLALNTTLTRRAAILSAQLSILGGLTSALAEHRNVDSALDSALHACLDAGGFSWGLLLVRQGTRWLRRSLGLQHAEQRAIEESPDAFMARMQLSAASRLPVRVSGRLVGIDDGGDALVVPVIHLDQLLGAVVLRVGETLDDQRMVFVQVIAGQIALVLAMARSFQDLEALSSAERERAQLLATTFDAIGEPILVVDAVGRPTRWNLPGTDFLFLGVSTPGERAPALLRGDQTTAYAAHELPIARALAGEDVDDAEICIQPGIGEPRWVRVTARPIHGDAGPPSGAVAVLRDFTDEKRRQAKQIVNDRLVSIGVLAAGVAHEINNPMTSVLAELEMALEDLPDGSPVRPRLQGALDAALRVRTIATDLRTLSRGGSTDARTPVALVRALDTAIRLAMPQTRGTTTVETDLRELPLVLANEARMVQVFLNLIVNAAQAMPENAPFASRRIRILTCTDENGGARVEIADTGVGMTPEVRQRLFTPFFTTKDAAAGTGLGLSICQRIVADAGGSIECDTVLGRGTSFVVRLPAAPTRSSTPPTSSFEVRSHRARLLVVDPDPLVHQMVGAALDEHDVVSVESAAEALAFLARGEKPDLLLLDALGAGMALPDLWAQLRTGSEDLTRRVVLLVARSTPGPALAFLAALDAPRLEKPLDGKALRTVVAEESSKGSR